jgi:hypothetical protein
MILQFLNRYALLLLPLLVVGGWAAGLLVRRAGRKWWLAWGGLSALLVAGFFSLRTPAATLTMFRPLSPTPVEETGTAPGYPDTSPVVERVSATPQFGSADEIRSFLAASGGKPTLVDFYTDFGVS